MTVTERDRSTGPAALPRRDRPPGFTLFAEMLLVGAIVTVLSLPVVTFLAALAAGAGHLRRHAALTGDPLSRLLAEFRENLRGVWGYGVALPLLLGVLVFNVLLLATTPLPGGAVVRWVSIGLGVAVCVVALRAVGRRARDRATTWREAVRGAGAEARGDLGGSVLLAVATGLCALLVWMLPILLVVVPGMLTLAVVAVENRRAGRTG